MREKKQGKPMAGTDRTPIGTVNGAVFFRPLSRGMPHIDTEHLK
jgi:hypothetical protein